jgi:hypothetical protein
MHTCIRVLTFVLSIVAVLTAGTVYPNGRTTPRSANASPVKATCIDRSDGERHDILRARINVGEGSSQKLTVLTDDLRQELPLPAIKRLTLPTAQVNGEGFMKATVVRRNDDKETEALVQAKSGSSKVLLAGFNSDGTDISIELSKCKEVEFSSAAGAGDSAEKPVMKH